MSRCLFSTRAPAPARTTTSSTRFSSISCTLPYQEMTERPRRGLPGVWTHGFYDGWAPNYTILSVASLHNSIGRFYETYTSLGAGCHTVHLGSDETDRRG